MKAAIKLKDSKGNIIYVGRRYFLTKEELAQLHKSITANNLKPKKYVT